MGEIVTFYSYKGGTGRSMALANVAWILASNGQRVLVIDWDLEAPGLHRYFHPFLLDKNLVSPSSRGLIEFVRDFAIEAATPDGRTPRSSEWYEKHANILRYATSLNADFRSEGTIDFVPAGQQGPAYASFINSFNWINFYERLGGGAFLQAARAQMKGLYDFVLIDSRTGVSDTSGICTVFMPDILVVCFTLNNQSIDGAAAVAESVAAQRRDPDGQLNIRILPVPMRVDPFEKHKLEQRQRLARSLFRDWAPERGYWADVALPYVPFYSYEETLATFGDEPGALNTVLAAAERLTGYITKGRIKALVPPSERERQQVLRAFEERDEVVATDSGGVSPPGLGARLRVVAAAVLVIVIAAVVGRDGCQMIKAVRTARAAALLSLAVTESDPLTATLLLAEAAGLPEPPGRLPAARKIIAAGAPLISTQGPRLSQAEARTAPISVPLTSRIYRPPALLSGDGRLLAQTEFRTRESTNEIHAVTRIWETQSGHLVDEFVLSNPGSLTFSPDISLLLNLDGRRVSVTDRSSGRAIAEFDVGIAGLESVQRVVLVPRGLMIIGTRGPGTVNHVIASSKDLGPPPARLRVWSVSVPPSTTITDADADLALGVSDEGETLFRILENAGVAEPQVDAVSGELPHGLSQASLRMLGSLDTFGARQWWLTRGYVVGTGSDTAVLLDRRTGHEVARVSTTGAVRSLASSADGRWLAVGNEDAAVTLHDLRTKISRILRIGGSGELERIQFDDAGALFLTMVGDDVRVWRTAMEVPADVDWPTLLRYARQATAACLDPAMRQQALRDTPDEAHLKWQQCNASHGRPTHSLTLPTDDAAGWQPDARTVNERCGSVLGAEDPFAIVSTELGPGVRLQPKPTPEPCCPCTRHVRAYTLGRVVSADKAQISGWFRPSRNRSEMSSETSFQLELLRGGRGVGSRIFTSEDAVKLKSCAGDVPERTLAPGSFNLPLSVLAGNAEIDEVRVRLIVSACGSTPTSVTLAGLQLLY